MSEHLEREMLSALIDEPETDPGATGHLETCPDCRREYETMRRMRMALSALGQLEPPAAAWDRIEARLPEVGRGRRWLRAVAGDGWVSASLRAAAAVILFAGGVALGLRAGGLPGEPALLASGPAAHGSEGSAAAPASAGDAAAVAGRSGVMREASKAAGGAGADPASLALGAGGPASRRGDADLPGGASGEGSTSSRGASPSVLASSAGNDVSLPDDLPRPYRAVFSRLEALRAQGPSPAQALQDPQAAAQHLARLDALIRASSEALRAMPADPAVNDFLFQVVAERNALDRVLHVVSLDYR